MAISAKLASIKRERRALGFGRLEALQPIVLPPYKVVEGLEGTVSKEAAQSASPSHQVSPNSLCTPGALGVSGDHASTSVLDTTSEPFPNNSEPFPNNSEPFPNNSEPFPPNALCARSACAPGEVGGFAAGFTKAGETQPLTHKGLTAHNITSSNHALLPILQAKSTHSWAEKVLQARSNTKLAAERFAFQPRSPLPANPMQLPMRAGYAGGAQEMVNQINSGMANRWGSGVNYNNGSFGRGSRGTHVGQVIPDSVDRTGPETSNRSLVQTNPYAQAQFGRFRLPQQSVPGGLPYAGATIGGAQERERTYQMQQMAARERQDETQRRSNPADSGASIQLREQQIDNRNLGSALQQQPDQMRQALQDDVRRYTALSRNRYANPSDLSAYERRIAAYRQALSTPSTPQVASQPRMAPAPSTTTQPTLPQASQNRATPAPQGGNGGNPVGVGGAGGSNKSAPTLPLSQNKPYDAPTTGRSGFMPRNQAGSPNYRGTVAGQPPEGVGIGRTGNSSFMPSTSDRAPGLATPQPGSNVVNPVAPQPGRFPNRMPQASTAAPPSIGRQAPTGPANQGSDKPNPFLPSSPQTTANDIINRPIDPSHPTVSFRPNGVNAFGGADDNLPVSQFDYVRNSAIAGAGRGRGTPTTPSTTKPNTGGTAPAANHPIPEPTTDSEREDRSWYESPMGINRPTIQTSNDPMRWLRSNMPSGSNVNVGGDIAHAGAGRGNGPNMPAPLPSPASAKPSGGPGASVGKETPAPSTTAGGDFGAPASTATSGGDFDSQPTNVSGGDFASQTQPPPAPVPPPTGNPGGQLNTQRQSQAWRSNLYSRPIPAYAPQLGATGYSQPSFLPSGSSYMRRGIPSRNMPHPRGYPSRFKLGAAGQSSGAIGTSAQPQSISPTVAGGATAGQLAKAPAASTGATQAKPKGSTTGGAQPGQIATSGTQRNTTPQAPSIGQSGLYNPQGASFYHYKNPPPASKGTYMRPKIGAAKQAERRPFSPEEQQLIDQGESNWFPSFFQSYSTPAHDMLASPGKQGLMTGLLGGAAGAGAGGLIGKAFGHPALGAAVGGLGVGGLAGLLRYASRNQENDNLKELIRRGGPDATKYDLMTDKVYGADLDRANRLQQAQLIAGTLGGLGSHIQYKHSQAPVPLEEARKKDPKLFKGMDVILAKRPKRKLPLPTPHPTEKAAIIDLALGGALGAMKAPEGKKWEGAARGSTLGQGFLGGLMHGGAVGGLAGSGGGALVGLMAGRNPVESALAGGTIGGITGGGIGAFKGLGLAKDVIGKPSWEHAHKKEDKKDKKHHKKKAEHKHKDTSDKADKVEKGRVVMVPMDPLTAGLNPLDVGGNALRGMAIRYAHNASKGKEDPEALAGATHGALSGLGGSIGGLTGMGVLGGLGGYLGSLAGTPGTASPTAQGLSLGLGGLGGALGLYTGGRAGSHLGNILASHIVQEGKD
jgi:hypothetical protein